MQKKTQQVKAAHFTQKVKVAQYRGQILFTFKACTLLFFITLIPGQSLVLPI